MILIILYHLKQESCLFIHFKSCFRDSLFCFFVILSRVETSEKNKKSSNTSLNQGYYSCFSFSFDYLPILSKKHSVPTEPPFCCQINFYTHFVPTEHSNSLIFQFSNSLTLQFSHHFLSHCFIKNCSTSYRNVQRLCFSSDR